MKPEYSDSQVISIGQAAGWSGYSESGLKLACRKGSLPSDKVGSFWGVRFGDLRRWFAGRMFEGFLLPKGRRPSPGGSAPAAGPVLRSCPFCGGRPKAINGIVMCGGECCPIKGFTIRWRNWQANGTSGMLRILTGSSRPLVWHPAEDKSELGRRLIVVMAPAEGMGLRVDFRDWGEGLPEDAVWAYLD